MKLFLLATVLLSACGSKTEDGKINGQTQEEILEQSMSSAPHSSLVQTAAALPACTPEAEGWLVYVKDVAQFQSCSAGAWTAIEVKGKDGAAGKDAGFAIVAIYSGEGAGTNLCDKYAPDTSCWIQSANVIVLSSGDWFVEIAWNHISISVGDLDTRDKRLGAVIPKGDTLGATISLDRFVFRNDGAGGDLWAFINKEKTSVKLIHDASNDGLLDVNDNEVYDMPLTKR